METNWSKLPYEMWLYIIDFVLPPIYKFIPGFNYEGQNKFAILKYSKAIDFFIANVSRVNNIGWISLNSNPKTRLLLPVQFDEISWVALSQNSSTWACKFIAESENIIIQSRTKGKKDIFNYYEHLKLFLSSNTNVEAINFLKRHINLINWNQLSLNESPHAIDLLKLYPNRIIWSLLSSNKSSYAIKLLKCNIRKINWIALSANTNPQAISLLELHLDKVCWTTLSSNECSQAVDLLSRNIHNICWSQFYINKCPRAIEVLSQITENLDNLNWSYILNNQSISNIDYIFNYISQACINSILGDRDLCHILSKLHNPRAINVLRGNLNKVNWLALSKNSSPIAFKLLMEHPNKICWTGLCSNENDDAIELLSKNIDKIANWSIISYNKNPKAIQLVCKHIALASRVPLHITDAYFEVDTTLPPIKMQLCDNYLKSFNIKMV